MNTIEIAENLFREIQSEFPDILMEINEEPNHVELNMDIPKQKGVSHPINLNLQNKDELHFSVSNFWCEWFPCTNHEIVAKFKDIDIGYLSGKYRILEYYKGNKTYKAEFQIPQNEEWSTIARWSRFSWPIYIKRTQRIIKNV